MGVTFSASNARVEVLPGVARADANPAKSNKFYVWAEGSDSFTLEDC